MRRHLKSVAAAVAAASALALAAVPAHAAGDAETPPSQNWSFDGFFGTFDLAELQRGWLTPLCVENSPAAYLWRQLRVFSSSTKAQPMPWDLAFHRNCSPRHGLS